MLIAAAALTAVSSFAQDKATLDLLVKKGLITAEERAKTLDESSQARAASGVGRVFPKEDATKRFTIGGYFQSQYESFSSSINNKATIYPTQSGFIMRRLYLELTADIGEGLSGNVVMDMSGNTNSRSKNGSESWLDRAILTLNNEHGTFDLGLRKVAWGYEESTLSSLFKASSSKLYTVERGITNRYWNEAVKEGRLGFGAHHAGLFYTSVPNPQGFEFGAAVTNANRDLAAAGSGLNDLGLYANVVWNNKISDNEKYAVGVNYGRVKFNDVSSDVTIQKLSTNEGYNPFVQAQYFNWTVYAEYMNTKLNDTKDGAARDHKPTGYNATIAYKINDNWEGVARYTTLDTDGRGITIGAGERDYSTTNGTGNYYNKSDAYYLGVNYYFPLTVVGNSYAGYNAKIQLGYEIAKFKGSLTAINGTLDNTQNAQVDAIRLQAQVAF